MSATFNMNTAAEVKLTKFGAEIYKKWEDGYKHPAIKRKNLKPGDTLRDQLWSLFQVFGPHLSLGSESPFINSEIRIVK